MNNIQEHSAGDGRLAGGGDLMSRNAGDQLGVMGGVFASAIDTVSWVLADLGGLTKKLNKKKIPKGRDPTVTTVSCWQY